MVFTFWSSIRTKTWDSPTFTTFLSLGVRLGGLLAVTPLLVTRLSAIEISAWYLFSSVIALCNLVDLGFAPTFSRLVSYVMAGADDLRDFLPERSPTSGDEVNWELMGRLYRTMRLVYAALAGVQFLLLATFGTASVAHVIDQMHDPAAGWQVWALVVVTATLNFACSRYACCLSGMSRVALVNRCTAFFGMLGMIGAIVSIVMGGGLTGLVLTYQGTQLVGALYTRTLLLRVEKGKFQAFHGMRLDRDILGAAWPPAWRSAVNIAGSTGVAHGISVIYAQLSDPQALADFLLTQRLIIAVASFSQAPFYAHIPDYATLRASGRLAELAASTAQAIERSLYVFLLGALAIAWLGNPALEYIHANARLLDGSFWAAWCVVFFLERHHAMHAQIYCTTNRVPFYVPVSISGVINLGLCYWLFPRFGVWAVVIAQAVSNALINNWWNVRISLGSLPRAERARFGRAVLRPACLLLVGVAAAWAWRAVGTG